MDFASSSRAAENRERWKGIVARSSVEPQRSCKVMDRIVQIIEQQRLRLHELHGGIYL